MKLALGGLNIVNKDTNDPALVAAAQVAQKVAQKDQLQLHLLNNSSITVTGPNNMGEKVSSRSIRGDSSLRKDSHKRNLTVGFNSAMTHHAIEPVRSIPGTYDLNTVSSPIFGYEEHVEPSFVGGVGGGLGIKNNLNMRMADMTMTAA